ncbi:urease accessory protein [Hasllibacter halocynthiae]|uniref:Urease accessory protein UreD n=1 Tax=Hasllibacter halocynthiae TaxID=595589 RepID=A0A2T0X8Q1_9RHOB|nr:urease accessory protein UreD [Hasllibacter halocynthiae]PRY95321.1 urease accessory protein [Hasllibacter halocynthiae]
MEMRPLAPLQRARGEAAVVLGAGGVIGLRQSGCGKAILPRTHGAAEAVFLNTSGGLTSGDRLRYALDLRAGRAAGTTQAAERAYAAPHGPAEVRVDLVAGPGAALRWLPQETILYDRAALHRSTVAELAPGASLLLLEMLVLGREAMGESVRALDLLDRREVRRAGRPVLLEPLRLTGDLLDRRASALTGGCRALATLAFVAPGAEDAAEGLRAHVPGLAVSGWAVAGGDGRCVARALGPAAEVRRAMAQAAERLGGPLPLVWQREAG